MRYTDQDRDHAVKLYTEHGTAEASRRTGIPARTILRWAKTAGVVSRANAKKTAPATAELRALSVERRVRVRAALLERTEHLLESITGSDPTGARNLAVAVGVLIDKYRLEYGQTTAWDTAAEAELDAELVSLIQDLEERSRGCSCGKCECRSAAAVPPPGPRGPEASR